MENFRDYLVFDRTQADVDRAKHLRSLFDKSGVWRGTAEEREELDRSHGVYTQADLNRVIRAYSYLSTCLYELGYVVSAPFYPAYFISVSSAPYGTGEAAGGGIFFKGETVTLTARPAEDFEFVMWKDRGEPVSYQDAYQFKAERSMHITAVFDKDGGRDLGVVGYGVIGRAKIGFKEM